MNNRGMSSVQVMVVENDVHFTLNELGRACQVDVGQLILLVDEGILVPINDGPEHWRFAGAELRRARLALRLKRELELHVSGLALVIDLLDQIDGLRARLRRAGLH